MPTIDPKVEYCMHRQTYAEALRAPFNADWEDIRNFVRPVTVSFNPTTGSWQYVRTELMFDGTAPCALEELGAALHSYLTNPAERWFEVQAEGMVETDLDPESLEWLELVSETIYASYRRDSCNFNLAIHESYLDIASFGTTALCQEWDVETQDIVFVAKPLQHCYFFENSKGRVDSVHIRYDWSLRQIKQEFGPMLPPELMKVENQDRVFQVFNCVYPRTDRMKGSALPQDMPYYSLWVCQNTKELLKESGYQTLPYHVARWAKLAGEIYGRGPAKKCLPDIKMLNAMERTILKAGQKAVDPPLILANEGFMLPIRTSPGALIYKEDEERKIEALRFEGNLPWAEDKAKQKRDFIEKCFYIDWIRREQKKAEQTATEIEDQRDEMLRQLAPMFGRLVTELHGPMIARSYHLLMDHGRIPVAPASLQGRNLRIGYLSPAARAQLGTKANAFSRFLQDLVPMAQIDPGVMDVVDFDQAAAEMALARGVTRKCLRDPKAVAEMRQQKQQQQAMAQMAQTAEPASNAIKNIADAQKMAP